MIDQLDLEGHTVKNICRILEINRSQYYRQRQEPKSIHRVQLQNHKRETLIENIRQIKSEHPFWGYRRVRAYLQYKMNIKASRKYVYRLMKENALLVDVKQYKAKRRVQREKPQAKQQNQGFRRFNLRGFEKVNAEFGLVAMAHNIKKVGTMIN